jgi:hypothetical protein
MMNASKPFVRIYELIRAPFDRKVGVGENKSTVSILRQRGSRFG